MKPWKKLLLGLLALLVMFIGIGFFLPAKQYIERSIIVRGKPEEVFNVLARLKLLFILHANLASQLDFPARQVAADNFYDWHRAYLWTASIQWLAGTALLLALHSAVCPTTPSNRADLG